MKIIYYILLIIVYNADFSKEKDFPIRPVQAPIDGLLLLIAGSAALAYKNFKK